MKTLTKILKPKVVERKNDNRVPLVIDWHQKFKGLSQILVRHYNFMVIEHPDLKKMFPEPPLVSYRRNPNLHNNLVSTKLKKNARFFRSLYARRSKEERTSVQTMQPHGTTK